jgi:sugar transferase (PEP-CTERM/EpsH1 system associated)
MTKRRILFVNHSLAMGGIETMIVDMVRLLPKDQFHAEVAVFEGGGSLEQVLEKEGITVHRLGKREGVDAGLFLRLRSLLRDGRFDVLHTHNYAAWLYGNVARRLAGTAIHVHTEHSGVSASKIRYAAERFLSKSTSFVVAVSDHVVDVLVNKIGVASSRVKLIYNGVNTARFQRNAAQREDVRQSLGIAPSEIVIGIVARLAPIKNHTYLLDAFAELLKSSPTVRLLIVGDGTERARLEAHAQQIGVSSTTIFTGERRDTERLLNAMDIYALASTSEGMNLTLLEAMSSGLPIVATAVGGNVEIVREGETGYLVPLNAPAEFARALAACASSETLRNTFGANARKSVAARFDEHAMIAQYAHLYRVGG